MHCEEVREQLVDYLIAGAAESADSRISEHLSACGPCRAELEELKGLWGALGSIPASAKPDPGARARFNRMLEAYEHGLERSAEPAQWTGWWKGMNLRISGWWPRRPKYQLAVALGSLLLGVLIGLQVRSSQLPSRGQSNSEIAALRNELAETRQMVALSLMQQRSASDRLKGVNWSSQLQQPGGEIVTALLDTLMHDPNVNVRLATVDALRQFGDQTVVRKGVLEAMSRQESPMVQVALIDLAVDLHETESVDTLRQLSTDPKLDTAVRDRAQKGLAQMR